MRISVIFLTVFVAGASEDDDYEKRRCFGKDCVPPKVMSFFGDAGRVRPYTSCQIHAGLGCYMQWDRECMLYINRKPDSEGENGQGNGYYYEDQVYMYSTDEIGNSLVHGTFNRYRGEMKEVSRGCYARGDHGCDHGRFTEGCRGVTTEWDLGDTLWLHDSTCEFWKGISPEQPNMWYMLIEAYKGDLMIEWMLKNCPVQGRTEWYINGKNTGVASTETEMAVVAKALVLWTDHSACQLDGFDHAFTTLLGSSWAGIPGVRDPWTSCGDIAMTTMRTEGTFYAKHEPRSGVRSQYGEWSGPVKIKTMASNIWGSTKRRPLMVNRFTTGDKITLAPYTRTCTVEATSGRFFTLMIGCVESVLKDNIWGDSGDPLNVQDMQRFYVRQQGSRSWYGAILVSYRVDPTYYRVDYLDGSQFDGPDQYQFAMGDTLKFYLGLCPVMYASAGQADQKAVSGMYGHFQSSCVVFGHGSTDFTSGMGFIDKVPQDGTVTSEWTPVEDKNEGVTKGTMRLPILVTSWGEGQLGVYTRQNANDAIQGVPYLPEVIYYFKLIKAFDPEMGNTDHQLDHRVGNMIDDGNWKVGEVYRHRKACRIERVMKTGNVYYAAAEKCMHDALNGLFLDPAQFGMDGDKAFAYNVGADSNDYISIYSGFSGANLGFTEHATFGKIANLEDDDEARLARFNRFAYLVPKQMGWYEEMFPFGYTLSTCEDFNMCDIDTPGTKQYYTVPREECRNLWDPSTGRAIPFLDERDYGHLCEIIGIDDGTQQMEEGRAISLNPDCVAKVLGTYDFKDARIPVRILEKNMEWITLDYDDGSGVPTAMPFCQLILTDQTRSSVAHGESIVGIFEKCTSPVRVGQLMDFRTGCNKHNCCSCVHPYELNPDGECVWGAKVVFTVDTDSEGTPPFDLEYALAFASNADIAPEGIINAAENGFWDKPRLLSTDVGSLRAEFVATGPLEYVRELIKQVDDPHSAFVLSPQLAEFGVGPKGSHRATRYNKQIKRIDGELEDLSLDDAKMDVLIGSFGIGKHGDGLVIHGDLVTADDLNGGTGVFCNGLRITGKELNDNTIIMESSRWNVEVLGNTGWLIAGFEDMEVGAHGMTDGLGPLHIDVIERESLKITGPGLFSMQVKYHSHKPLSAGGIGGYFELDVDLAEPPFISSGMLSNKEATGVSARGMLSGPIPGSTPGFTDPNVFYPPDQEALSDKSTVSYYWDKDGNLLEGTEAPPLSAYGLD